MILNTSVYLIDDERNRLMELINLINERRVYVNNQISSNEELTGIRIDADRILGEDRLDEYKTNLKIIDKYKSNIKLEVTLKDEIKNLDITIKKANQKINSNKNLNRQLEDKMIKLVDGALNELSLYELKEREKEIDLAYTELGYSLEKAKENAKIARKDYSEEIVLECDNILASTTLDYERYKEKKLILKLIYLYRNPVSDYDELFRKREEMNTILCGIVDSELYSIIGNELNKQYSTIKLEAQDINTLKSLMEEKKLKMQSLENARQENDSASVKGLLSTLLLNEKKHQEKLDEERLKREEERRRIERIKEQKRIEEALKRQKELEEERNKEIEKRTKQLLDEKKNSLLSTSKEEKKTHIISNQSKKVFNSQNTNVISNQPKRFTKSHGADVKRVNNREEIFKDINKNDFFAKNNERSKVVREGIPVVKDNRVVTAKKSTSDKIFPDIPIHKEEDIFPDKSSNVNHSSFFDENEFNDLSNYVDDGKKKWF